MNPSDINYDDLRNLTIGTVESVSPREIRVLLDLNAPQNTALNTGIPTLFPKINGYVLLPNEAGALIGMISWIGIEHSPYPKRKGFKDFDLVDLPFPLRKMSISPLGILKKEDKGYKIERGVYSYPSVGDAVVIPTHEQLQSIVENKDENAKIKIGDSPLAANAPVYVDPDKLFGRHLAVLGNTGSGKSCSVAGLIRWSLEAIKNEIGHDKNPNARFIILDPNGEYTKTFEGISGKVRIFKVAFDEKKAGFEQLKVPAWMWNSYEWSSISQASGKTQRPLLRQALRAMRNQVFSINDSTDAEVKNFLGTLLTSIKIEKSNGSPWGSFPRPKNFTEKIKKWQKSIESFLGRLANSSERIQLDDLNTLLDTLLNDRSEQYPTYEFDIGEVNLIQEKILNAFEGFGGSEQDLLAKSEDVPVPFKSDVFVHYLDALGKESESSQYLDYLLMRLRTILSDTRISSVIGTETDISLTDWLEKYVGKNNAENGAISVIDLSLVPTDIIHIIVAVMSRIIFESLQRYKRKYAKLLPTVLVMEEAHNFISKYNREDEEFSPSRLCSQSFEKIAKEGRKFGLGLLLSSQRPSELSPTVLSQCNTFLLHRLVNDRDQEMVKKFVPDNLGSILNELPVLPTKKAILLGWAAPVPILVDMNELKKEHQPDSKDPDFWDVWAGKEERKIDWKEIVDEWQKEGDNEENK
jgi:DNA helicase HerA-like ATPase